MTACNDPIFNIWNRQQCTVIYTHCGEWYGDMDYGNATRRFCWWSNNHKHQKQGRLSIWDCFWTETFMDFWNFYAFIDSELSWQPSNAIPKPHRQDKAKSLTGFQLVWLLDKLKVQTTQCKCMLVTLIVII